MFEKYAKEQPIAVKTLLNAIQENKLSHAYIFETNNYHRSYDFIIDFIKYIECSNYNNINHNEEDCNICSAINNNNFVELKIINSDALQIKKEEMTALQQEFKNKAIEGNKKIYLIKNAEKLNSSSSNTILKFLEEPEENIIAILMTSSRYLLMSTILSRCQIISFNNTNQNNDILIKIYNEYYSNVEYNEEIANKIKENITIIFKFIEKLEINKHDTLLFTTELFLKYFKTREEIYMAFEIVRMIYYEILKYKTSKSIKYFYDNKEKIISLSNRNTIKDLSIKLDIIMKNMEKIKYNVNTSLLIDKFIMQMGGNFCD